MRDARSLLVGHRVIPVVSAASADEADQLAESLVRGGLPIAEVTLRRPGALDEIRRVAARGDLLVGAGTVRTARQLHDAVAAGARFVVSPCVTASLLAAAAEHDVPFVPGTATGSEIQQAADSGVRVVKFFPAERIGGYPALAALAEPFHDMWFVPTGGIAEHTAPAYLAHPRVLAVGGSWMLPTVPRAAGDWDAVTDAVARCAALIRDHPAAP